MGSRADRRAATPPGHRARPRAVPDADRDPAASVAGEEHRFWRATLDSLPDRVAVLDQAGDIVAVNRPWREFAHADGGEGLGVGANYLDVCDRAGVTDSGFAETAGALREIVTGSRDSYDGVHPCHTSGRSRWLSVHAAPIDGAGERRVVLVHHDVTVGHEAERRSRDQAVLLEAVDAAIMATDLDGIITDWSPGAERIQGWTAAEVIGRPLASVNTLDDDDGGAATEAILSGLRDRGSWDGELELRRADGSRFPAYVRDRLRYDHEGRPNGVVGVAVDLTDRVAAETKLREALAFMATVAGTIPNGLVALDADDHATLVNEAAETMLGWPAGELLGRPVFELFCGRGADGSPRSVSDWLSATRSDPEATARADDVFQRRDGSLLAVEYALAPLLTGTAGTGRVLVFSDITRRKERELEVQRELEAISWVGRIRDALEQDRFVLYAQPIVELSSGDSLQHELLVRMVDADGTVVAPGAFLPVAEQHGLIKAIDRRVFAKAVGYARAGHHIHVNLSGDSISDPETLEFVQRQLDAAAVDPGLVIFEITETSLIQNEAVAQAFITHVRALGCGVALDDFGTGYGSFRYLKHLPVDVLKIDQEFIRDPDPGAEQVNGHVIRAIVALARGMGQKTVAEGVETAATLARVRELGVDFAQGYYFARPAPADEVLRPGVRDP